MMQMKKWVSFVLALFVAVSALNIPVVFAEELDDAVSETLPVETTAEEASPEEPDSILLMLK